MEPLAPDTSLTPLSSLRRGAVGIGAATAQFGTSGAQPSLAQLQLSHGVEKVTDTGAGPTPCYWLVTVGGGKGVESRPPPRKPQVSIMGWGAGVGRLASLLCFPPNPHLTSSFSSEFPRLFCHTSSSSAISLQVPVAMPPGPSRSSVSISAELCTLVNL